MQKKIVWFGLLAIPALLLASGHAEESRYFAQTGRESDFVPRIVNFLIFAGLLYYLIADPIRNFFKNRSQGIADRLKEIEEKLQAAKLEKEEAQQRYEESVKKAEEIVADAKEEAKLLAKKVAEQIEQEATVLEKSYEEKMELEARKAYREAIDEVLSENITAEDIPLDASKVIDIISKKAA